MALYPNILAMANPLDHVVPHSLFKIPIPGTDWTMDFNSHLLMILVAAIVLCIVLPLSVRQRSMVPRGLRNLIESVCVYIREEVARPVLGDATDRFIIYLWTIFYFILFINLVGMVPTDALIYLLSGGHIKHIGGTATANIWVTGALASMAFIVIHLSGMKEQGFFTYWKNFVPHVPWPMLPLMYVVELIGALVKPFALAMRLFANMLAGHTVLASLMAMVLMSRSLAIEGVTIAAAAVFSLLELFVAFLQAYIFTFLTAMFIASAIHPEH